MYKSASADSPSAYYLEDLKDGLQWQNRIGGAALMTGGAALIYTALKKLVDESYKSKLYDSLKKNKDVDKTYANRDAVISNEFINAMEDKVASADNQLYKSARKIPLDAVVPASKIKPFNSVTKAYASDPYVGAGLMSLALGTAIPAAWFGGNALAKSVLKPFKASDKSNDNDRSVARARKEYEEAARILAKVTHSDTIGKRKKKSADIPEEELLDDTESSGDPYAYLSKAGSLYKSARSHGEVKYRGDKLKTRESGGYITGLASTLLAAIAAVGTGYGGWRFSRGLTQGYESKADEISDLTRASQAWEASLQNRTTDVLPYRARLSNEDTLDLRDLQLLDDSL